MSAKPSLTEILNIEYPIIMAPMFLVSNAKMLIAGANNGIATCIPALNYRTDEEFRAALDEIRSKTDGAIGINLIVNKSNPKVATQLKTCLDKKVDFIITSLGNPKEVIEACKPAGIKVFCDVVDLAYAKKVEELGADAVIAVNNRAGGHAGNMSPEELIPLLNENCAIPIISAGGVGNKEDLDYIMSLGACGVSVGSIFIASEESDVSDEYKQACVDFGKDDIVMSTKVSGTPCTVINTPYVQKIGTKQNWFERVLSKNKRLKKWVKMLTFVKGMKALEKSAFSATYKTVWCAGPTIENTTKIEPVAAIIKRLVGK
ncbi:nitronate monooxygenase [Paracrocinitomix mangrovi]|uniref:NAD(P)H-dependent flavin oxidoreductase n=1 Tax=Paracrocinitomix mangrovi TaxID=2862509 RepID=UPI001C8E1720|nr:nitronate monooxygenase [Paracrocinitomix mangrovi]UKN02450.1 nitronate monooxygenase [Paracrocinitomix mangrovi]